MQAPHQQSEIRTTATRRAPEYCQVQPQPRVIILSVQAQIDVQVRQARGATGPKMMATLSYVEEVVLPVAGVAEREEVDLQEDVAEGGVPGVGALAEVRRCGVVGRPVKAKPVPATVPSSRAPAAPAVAGDRRDAGEA